jgi:hypothetical protein
MIDFVGFREGGGFEVVGGRPGTSFGKLMRVILDVDSGMQPMQR